MPIQLFATLYQLYVRVETFAKQSIPNKSFSHKYLAYIYS